MSRMLEKIRRLEEEADSSRKDRDYYRTRCVALEAQVAARPPPTTMQIGIPNVVRVPFAAPPPGPALSTVPLMPKSKAALARQERAALEAEIERERTSMAYAASHFGVDLVPRHWHDHQVQHCRELEAQLGAVKATLSYKRKRDEQEAELSMLRAENAKLKKTGDAAAAMAALGAVEVDEDTDFV